MCVVNVSNFSLYLQFPIKIHNVILNYLLMLADTHANIWVRGVWALIFFLEHWPTVDSALNPSFTDLIITCQRTQPAFYRVTSSMFSLFFPHHDIHSTQQRSFTQAQIIWFKTSISLAAHFPQDNTERKPSNFIIIYASFHLPSLLLYLFIYLFLIQMYYTPHRIQNMDDQNNQRHSFHHHYSIEK